MKKMIFALVAMVMMSVSALAQSSEPNREFTFDRISSYLELTIEQTEPFRTAMAQFVESQKSVEGILEPDRLAESWGKVISRHKKTMKSLHRQRDYPRARRLSAHIPCILGTAQLQQDVTSAFRAKETK